MGLGGSTLEKNLGPEFPENEHYFGFENYGNTCYCNSVLQILYFCLPFRKAVIEYYEQNKEGEKEETLLSCLSELFFTIYSQKKRTGVIGPKGFIAKLKKENSLFRGYMHQDAHEFLNYILNEVSEILQKQLKKKISENNKTFIHNIFEGTLTNETKCITCGNITYRDESFLDLSLEIEQNVSISTCLKNFSSTEILKGRDKFFCENCYSKQEAQRRMLIKKLPPILVLHLKRFKYAEQLNRYKKLLYRVVFPLQLRLQNTVKDSPDSEKIYQLHGFVVHIGSGPNYGHYISILKSHNHWLRFDDDEIKIIEENDIRECFGVTNEMLNYPRRTDCGYLLFYQSIDSNESVNVNVPTSISNTSIQLMNTNIPNDPIDSSFKPTIDVELKEKTDKKDLSTATPDQSDLSPKGDSSTPSNSNGFDEQKLEMVELTQTSNIVYSNGFDSIQMTNGKKYLPSEINGMNGFNTNL